MSRKKERGAGVGLSSLSLPLFFPIFSRSLTSPRTPLSELLGQATFQYQHLKALGKGPFSFIALAINTIELIR